MSEPIARPPRFWWLKRLSAAGLVLLALLLALRIWWARIAQNRFEAEIAAAHTRGEPIMSEDFQNPDPPPDYQNAAVGLKAAAGAIFYNTAQQGFDGRFDVILSDADRGLLDGIVTGNAKAIATAKAALDLPQVDWGVRITSPVINLLFAPLNGTREVANLLNHCVYNDHIHRRDADVIEDIHYIFVLSDLMERDHPFLVTHLVAVGINAMGSSDVEHLADTLDISSATSPASGAATPAQVRKLIAQILDDRDYIEGGTTEWYAERLLAVDFLTNHRTMPFSPMQLSGSEAILWPVRPMFELDYVGILQSDAANAQAMKSPTYPAAMAAISASARSNSTPLASFVHQLSQSMQPSFGRLYQTHYRGLAERRAAAILLAIRLYEFDSGQPPPNLDALVPNYLPAVPIDPMTPDAHPFRYLATPGSEAVYSVGDDGVDDGGSMQPLNPNRTTQLGPFDTKDVVFPLHPPPPHPPTTDDGL